jgi:hypothetical protein
MTTAVVTMPSVRVLRVVPSTVANPDTRGVSGVTPDDVAPRNLRRNPLAELGPLAVRWQG